MEHPNDLGELKEDRARFLAFAFTRADFLIELDRAGQMTFVSGTTKWATGIQADAMVGRKITSVLMPASAPVVREILGAFQAARRLDPATILFNNAGEPVAASVAGGCLPDRPDRYYLTIAHPGADDRIAASPASGTRDAATNLLDEKSFGDRAKAQLEAARARGDELRMTMIELTDLNAFKSRVSEQSASSFLRGVGMILQRNSAGGDSAGQVGDGKFSVLHGKNVDEAEINREIAELSRKADPTGVGVKVVSNELLLDVDGMDDADAGRALVYAVNKFAQSHSGAFSVKSLSAGLRELVKETVAKVSNFRSAVANNSFHLVYQPIVDLRTRDVRHQEALTRLADGSSPFAMVTFAEELGVVSELDHSVSHQVLMMLEQNESVADVAINISGRSLESELFMSALEELFRQHATVRRRVLIEITESSRITNMEAVRKFIERFRAANHRVCLDDFGAGAAAFHYLRAFEVDTVKIDGDYVKNIKTNKRDYAFVRSIASLCADLKVSTVAEYCEMPDQVDMLIAAGVEKGQGYLFGKPRKELYMKKASISSGMAAQSRRTPATNL